MSFGLTYHALNKADAEHILEQKASTIPDSVYQFLKQSIQGVADGPVFVSASGHLHNSGAEASYASSAVIEVRPFAFTKPVIESKADPEPMAEPVADAGGGKVEA